MKRRIFLVVGTAMVAGLMISSAVAAPGGGGGNGGGGGPPDGGEEAANNLSVPAIFVPSVGVGTSTCTAADDTVLPNPADVSTVFPGYWIQGEDVWQADCMTAAADTVSATAGWGDNLTGAPLKAGTPIRVEMGLTADAATYPMTGFTVEKLTDELDRLATYGTNDGSGITPYAEVRVWNAGATLSIIRDSDGAVVYDGLFTAEINSTGRVVYGYNWTDPDAGIYTITFTAPTVTIIGAVVGDFTAHTAFLSVDVAASAGGGGGGGTPGGGNPGGGGGNVPDNDDDGWANNEDNCEDIYNPDQADTDGDGIGDACDTDGTVVYDADGDGLVDSLEAVLGTHPGKADTDKDGLTDAEEYSAGMDPRRADGDHDGLNDSEELHHGTSPWEADTDNDGVNDGKEVKGGSDPNDSSSKPPAPGKK